MKNEDFVPQGVCTIFNTLALQISIKYENTEPVIYSRFVGVDADTTQPVVKTKVYYNNKSEPYFMRYRKRYYISDFLKLLDVK